MNTFASQIEAMLNKARNKADNIVSEAVLDLQQQIVDATPEDTGQAKSNWFVEADQCSGKTTKDTSQGNLAEARQLLSRLKSGKSVLPIIICSAICPISACWSTGYILTRPKFRQAKRLTVTLLRHHRAFSVLQLPDGNRRYNELLRQRKTNNNAIQPYQ